jgi:hypothetical protein
MDFGFQLKIELVKDQVLMKLEFPSDSLLHSPHLVLPFWLDCGLGKDVDSVLNIPKSALLGLPITRESVVK